VRSNWVSGISARIVLAALDAKTRGLAAAKYRLHRIRCNAPRSRLGCGSASTALIHLARNRKSAAKGKSPLAKPHSNMTTLRASQMIIPGVDRQPGAFLR